ncbi:MAG: two-component response regulator [Herbinix sp.]|jgi:two-component system response regulator YesN|nr:two-component response regulator [Herbinix sp.]
MKQYSVILVDDEEDVRQAIIKKLDWESIGFQVIGYADNGEDALEIAERLRPDVIMTDIKMPFMDGLTLSRKLKLISKDIKIIVFSGFDDFEYAKEAIKLEVEEYILKPINAIELKGVFERIKEKLDNEINSKRDIELLRNYYKESLPVMKEQLLIGLLEGRISKKRVDELMSFYELNLDYPYFMAGIVRMDTSGTRPKAEEGYLGKSGLITLSLKQIVDENLANSLDYISCFYLETVVVIALLNDPKQSKDFIHIMDQVCKSAFRILEHNTSAGIGFLCNDLMELSHSYQGAKNAIDYRILLDSNQAIYIRDVETQENVQNVWESRYTENILREIKLGEVDDLVKAIQDLINYIKNSNISFQLYQVSLMEMVTEIFKLGRAYQLDLDKVFGQDFNINTKIYQFDSLEALKQWLLDSCVKVRSSIRRERTDTAKLMINKALDYLGEHYCDSEMSVDTLCGYLNVSATYFSILFKRETGLSFVNYLTKVRMEKALQLLNATDEKTYNISTMVGYTEPNYFSYVFKKYYGVSPSNYRKNK